MMDWGSLGFLHLELPQATERAGGGMLSDAPLEVSSESTALVAACSRYAEWCKTAFDSGVVFL